MDRWEEVEMLSLIPLHSAVLTKFLAFKIKKKKSTPKQPHNRRQKIRFIKDSQKLTNV